MTAEHRLTPLEMNLDMFAVRSFPDLDVVMGFGMRIRDVDDNPIGSGSV